MRSFACTLVSALIGFCMVAMTMNCASQPSSSNVGPLIQGNKWKEASREIFHEARLSNKFELSIPLGQAKAGFLEDAIDTIGGMHPNMQPGAILSIVFNVSSIPKRKKMELIQYAFDITTKMPQKSDYLKSGLLAEMAIFHSQNDAEEYSRVVFEKALSAAESGASKKGSGGYRGMTEVMAHRLTPGQGWMIFSLKQQLQPTEKSINSALAYRDLAQSAARIEKKELALELVELGISAAKTIKQASLRKSSLESLARVAIEAGYDKKLPEIAPDTLAIQQARLGNFREAYSIVSLLSENLYVDRRLEAYKKVLDDAVEHGNLKTAIYFAQRPIRSSSWIEAESWRKVAELQAKSGMKNDAEASYQNAALAISKNWVRSLDQVKASVALAKSMRQQGLDMKGRRVIIDALNMSDLISERRPRERVMAGTLLSVSLYDLQMFAEAKQQIARAYVTASEYVDKAGLDKARLLSEVGQAASLFILKTRTER